MKKIKIKKNNTKLLLFTKDINIKSYFNIYIINFFILSLINNKTCFNCLMYNINLLHIEKLII